MITLRTLKKLSKRALPVMQKHFTDRLGEVFPAKRGENYHGLVIRCTHGAGDPDRVKGRSHCECSWNPLPGTPMTGQISGYYEPEWDEQTVYELLRDVLGWSDKPDSMTEAEWVAALRIVGMTPSSHAKRMADLEREMSEEDEAQDAMVALSCATPAPTQDREG